MQGVFRAAFYAAVFIGFVAMPTLMRPPEKFQEQAGVMR
jgi:hypothetical protein